MTPTEFMPTSADTKRLHRIRARLLELVPPDGEFSLWDDVQRLELALADAEARGRQHGLLAAMMALAGPHELVASTRSPSSRYEDLQETLRLTDRYYGESMRAIIRLAAEATDGR